MSQGGGDGMSFLAVVGAILLALIIFSVVG